MSSDIEKEFKNLLTKEEYDHLFEFFALETVQPIRQTNVYYDTADMRLKDLGMGLRFRLLEDTAEFTLKSPLRENEKLETTDLLSLEEALRLIEQGRLVETGHVARKLAEYDIAVASLRQLGQLTTRRYEIPYQEGHFCLDKSFYASKIDYELEYEAASLEKGARLFEEFLMEHAIKKRDTPQKIKRMLDQGGKND